MVERQGVLLVGDRLDLTLHLERRGATVASAPGPFGSLAGARAALAEAARTLGRVEVVVYACVPDAALTPQALAETREADWDARCEAPLRSARYTAQAAFEHLRDRGGRIIFLTSTAGLVGEARFVPYAAASEGMRALARSAARQWGAHGITVNCVATALGLFGAEVPTPVEPPALGRAATAADVADAIALLAGDAGGAITGVTLPVDGGIVMPA